MKVKGLLPMESFFSGVCQVESLPMERNAVRVYDDSVLKQCKSGAHLHTLYEVGSRVRGGALAPAQHTA